MTNKGQLWVKILYRSTGAFLAKNFGPFLAQFSTLGDFFKGWIFTSNFIPSKGTPLRETASFEPSRVKIR